LAAGDERQRWFHCPASNPGGCAIIPLFSSPIEVGGLPSWRATRAITLLHTIALHALSFAFGLQSMRLFLPALPWYQPDLVGTSFVFFMSGLLAPLLWGAIGRRWSLWLTAGGLALVRLALQVSLHPGWDFWLSAFGTGLFLLYLPISFSDQRMRLGAVGGIRWAEGMILALALDTALQGAGGTVHLNWIGGTGPLLVSVTLGLAALALLASQPTQAGQAADDTPWSEALPIVAVGPFLLLQMLILQNPGWVAEIGAVDSRLASLIVVAGNLLILAGLFLGCMHARQGPLFALAVSIVLLLASSYIQLPSRALLLLLPLVQVALGWALGRLLPIGAAAVRRPITATTVALSLGMWLFLGLLFAYYASFVLDLPIPHTAIPPISAGIIGLCLFFARRPRPSQAAKTRLEPPLFVATLALTLLPAMAWNDAQVRPRPPRAPDDPLTVITYNIHSGFAVDGRQSLEAIARVIEASGADVVALQEISRGWLISGAVDMPAWFARRLGMRFVFRGTADPLWGNAILTHLPILEHGAGDLPQGAAFIRRGYLWAVLDDGASPPLRVIATHLHHIGEEAEVRLLQVPVLLDVWGGSPATVLLGDLNAKPGTEEMGLIQRAGLLDTWAEVGEGPGLTIPAGDPQLRVDWIWHTPDLVGLDAYVVASTASDHRPVVATLARRIEDRR